MQDTITSWEGEAWQEYVEQLLHAHYGVGDYQSVPDRGGDYGIEGWSADGCAYQCYAAKEPLSYKDLREKQRDKINADLGKFCKNRAILQRMFGSTVISRWLLVVPRFDSADLLSYAADKAVEVRAMGLPYVATDFAVMVKTDKHFPKALTILGIGERPTVRLGAPDLAEQRVDSYRIQQPTFIANLRRKVAKIVELDSEEEREAFRREMLEAYLGSEDLLGQLKANYLGLYERVLSTRVVRSRRVRTQSLLSSAPPNERLLSLIEEVEVEIEAQVPALTHTDTHQLAMGFVAAWLLECDLDFKASGGRHG